MIEINIDYTDDMLEDELANVYRDSFGNLLIQNRVDKNKILKQRALPDINFTGDSFGLNGESCFYYMDFSIIGLN